MNENARSILTTSLTATDVRNLTNGKICTISRNITSFHQANEGEQQKTILLG